MGCAGCELCNSERRSCYAAIQHDLYGGVRQGYSPTFSNITFWPGRMAATARLPDLNGLRRNEKPWLNGMPRIIFIGDMGDVLCDSVPFEYLRAEVIDIVMSYHGRRHNWLMLTKRAGRMAEFSRWLEAQGVAWPANLAAGTTITSIETTQRIDELLCVGNGDTVHFVSVEPQLESLDLRSWLPHLDWVIQGGESGRQPRKFDTAWAQQMHEHCQQHGVSYFLKQLGGHVFRGEDRIRLHDSHGADWNAWPDGIPKVREIPGFWAKARESDMSSLPACGHFGSGNDKLDSSIFDYAMTPIAACPGCKHALCSELRPDGNAPCLPMCFGCRGRYRKETMKERLAKNFRFAQSDLFVPWANEYIARHRHQLKAVRMPGVGDLFSIEFIDRVRAIVLENSTVKFFLNTRVWCVPELWAEVQRKLKGLSNLSVWLSWDRKMAARYGTPPDRDLPWTWLAETDDDVPPTRVTLVYRYTPFSVWNYKPSVLLTIGGCIVCPDENGLGSLKCGDCGICYLGPEFREARIAELLRDAGESWPTPRRALRPSLATS